MKIDDMILVSVDDHVVEPPHIFEKHLPQKYQDRAPKQLRKKDGTDCWLFQGRPLPNIGLNAVVALPDERYGERICAYVILRPGSSLELEDVGRHFAAEGVARQKTPERLVPVDDLPRTAAGKVKKFVLRERLRGPS